jgi:hypothetical protein
MRQLRRAAFFLFLFFTSLTLAHGQQAATEAAVSGLNGMILCDHPQAKNGKLAQSVCTGSFSDPNGLYSGAAASGAFASSKGLGINGSVAVVRADNGPAIQMGIVATADFDDELTVVNAGDSPFLFIASGMAAGPGGISQATVYEQINLIYSNTSAQCVTQTLPPSSCSVLLAVPTGSPAQMQIILIGQAEVVCGPPSCGGGEASIDLGYKEPGGGQILIVKVVDSSGNPIRGATVNSTSGHKYPSLFASTIALNASPNPSAQGQLVAFTATISSFGRSSTPTGRVTFKDSTTGATLGHAALVAGVATLSTSSLASGTHTIQANYSGDEWSASSRTTVSQVVN